MPAVEAFELVLALLGVVVALYWLASRLHVPPATALLVGGGALAFIPGLPEISLDPELVLVLFLPPLLFWPDGGSPRKTCSATAPSSLNWRWAW